MYGLESAQLTAATMNTLNTIRVNQFRQILSITATYIHRTHTDTCVMDEANMFMNPTNKTICSARTTNIANKNCGTHFRKRRQQLRKGSSL